MKERNGKPNKRRGLFLALTLLFLSGCAAAVTESTETPPPTPTPVVTAAPTPTPRPTATPTPTPFVTLCGQSFYRKKELLDFSGRETMTESELREIADNADKFPELQTVRLPADPEDAAPYIALMRELAARGIDTEWEFRLYGVTVRSTDTEIDLTKRRIPDIGAAAEEAAEWMPYLKTIDMSGCGLTDETMDKIDKRHETVRFVWTVYFSAFSLRTDSTNFIAARTYNKAPLTSYDMRILRYCPDLIALDLGHKDISDLSFLYDVPNLRYLILVENNIRDITPIGSLKELEYLELFWTKVEDPSPLIQCTKLLDLNICYIYTKADKAMEVLTQMPWLERLWYCGSGLSEEQKTALQEALPACEMYLLPHAESTGGGWREHPRYFEMRDAFEMYYMPGGTNGVAEDGSQIVLKG